jgi:N-acetylglucosaminyldiphosphoundecaprenol N-acetyl-beta-D-mannosaminyltransferase
MQKSLTLPSVPRYRLLGVELNALDLAAIVAILEAAIDSGRKLLLANQNLHSVYICSQDARVRAFFEGADYTHIDGTSLIFAGRLKGLPFHSAHRMGYMDLFPALVPVFVRHRWRVFYLGAKPEVLQAGLASIRRTAPDLEIEGHHGYFDKVSSSEENCEVLTRINNFRPHVLFVGMGMPIQEHWIFENQPSLDTNVILHCGALMDYIAGAIPTPPRWLGPIGLEWAFRLLTEPRRLWRRYFFEPLHLLLTLFLATRHRSR